MECETQESESGYIKRLIEFILTQNVHVQVQGKLTLSSSKFIQFFNQQNSSHKMYYFKGSIESKFDVKYVNTVKLTAQQVGAFKSYCLGRSEQNIGKQIDCKRPLSTKQVNIVDYKMFVLKFSNTTR